MQKDFVVQDVAGQCHGSTVCRAGSHHVVAWFEGDHEGAANSRIWCSTGDADAWASPQVVSGELGPCWNPVLHLRLDGVLLLYFKVGQTISAWQTYLVRSVDAGCSWSTPVPLVAGDRGARGPVRTPPVRLRSGRLVGGASTESWGEPARWSAFVELSDDDGLHWRRTADIAIDRDTFPGAGIIQPTLWQAPSGEVRLLARSTAGRLVSSASHDDGETWAPGNLSTLANNNSGISAHAVDDVVYLAHNPTSGDWASRAPLLISRSADGGATWQPWATVEASSPSAPEERYQPADSGVRTTGHNEFSYPCLIGAPSGLAVTYTWQRRAIALAVLDTSTGSDP